MRTLLNMNQEDKNKHFNSILNKINKSKYIIEDVTPKGYSPDEEN